MAVLLTVFAPLAGADTTASDVVQTLHRALVTQAGVSDYEQRRAALEPIVRDTHDLPAIARLVAGRDWREWDPERQHQFSQRFEKLTVALYAGRFHDFSGDPFQLVEERPAARGNAQVLSDFDPGDGRPPLRFDYLLSREEGGWRIVNIRVDGVSDIALRRAETARRLEEAGFDAVLRDMQDEIDRLARGEGSADH